MPDQVEDDETISNQDEVWRRIRPDQLVRDDNRGGIIRPSTSAFNNSSDGSGMSDSLAGAARAAGLTPHYVIERYPGYSVAALAMAMLRENGQGVIRKPTDDDPHHVEVNGDKPKKIQRIFATSATWALPPPEGQP